MITSIQSQESAVGRVVTPIKVENLEDLFRAKKRDIPPGQVRMLELNDALVDTGTTLLSLPKGMIKQLGLDFLYTRRGTTTSGFRKVKVYSSVRLTIQGRDCRVDVAEVSDKTPALVGQVPLELLDLVVDPRQARLIPNPAHGGEWMIEMY